MRQDLLNLTPDDLASLSNRGLVKRAQRELESGDFQAEWEEREDQSIVARWSDGVRCEIPAGATLAKARCDCPALELCRHTLRTVLAWQEIARRGGSVEPEPPAAWDPGAISDESIAALTTKPQRDKAEALWREGVLVELLRAVKPSARFHSPGHTVRFLVPGDLRYAKCGCPEPAPCVHALLATRAFRLLEPGLTAGLVCEGPLAIPVPAEPLREIREVVADGFENGLANASPAWRDRLRRVANLCREQRLIWPGQLLDELADDFDRHAAQDGLFDPEAAFLHAAELLLRVDALESGRAPVPQLFLRGSSRDRDTELGSSRFIGLGAMVTESRGATAIHVLMQETDSGQIVSCQRDFPEKEGVAARSYAELARTSAVKDAGLALLAAGQLLLQGGKRTAAGRLLPGRAKAAVNPQSYAWEQLRPPALAEDFAEIAARLSLLPPAWARPRGPGADFHVCPLTRVTEARFDPAQSTITALLHDAAGGAARLSHPWSERGRDGAEALLAALQADAARPLFIAGRVRRHGNLLAVIPSAYVFAGENGTRQAVIPALGGPATGAGSGAGSAPGKNTPVPATRHRHPLSPALELATDVFLQGHRRHRASSGSHHPGHARCQAELEAAGLHRAAAMVTSAQNSPAGLETLTKWLGLAMLR